MQVISKSLNEQIQMGDAQGMALIVQFYKVESVTERFPLFYVGNTFCPLALYISVATNQSKGANYNGTIIRKRRPPNDLN